MPNQKRMDQLIFLLGILLAVWLRFSLRSFESIDFHTYLQPWYNFIVEHGGFSALKYRFSNYSPPYMYWLVIAATALSGLPKLVSIKLLAASFDFICAFFVYKIVQLKYPAGKRAIIAFFTVLFTPTVFLNSSYWGQCDVIYTTGVLACLYFLLINQEIWAFLCFGLAIAFKQQALFLTPLLLILLLKQKVSWKSFALLPLTYFVAILPTWLAGRSLSDILLIYVNQTNDFHNLTKMAPNLYQWLSDRWYNVVVPLGMGATLVLLVCFVLSVYRSRVELSRERILQLALLNALWVPYVLPKMHDRYFFMADILSIVFAFYFPRYLWVAIVVETCSLFSYAPVLLGDTVVSLKVLSIALGATLWFLVRLHARTFYPHPLRDNSQGTLEIK